MAILAPREERGDRDLLVAAERDMHLPRRERPPEPLNFVMATAKYLRCDSAERRMLLT